MAVTPSGHDPLPQQSELLRADPSLDEPLYRQVEKAIRERIASGTWTAGTKIPPEAELCELHRVSRITVRHALRNLVDQGLLERRQGKGTFVRDHSMIAGVRGLTSFTDEVLALGRHPGALVLDIRLTDAPESVAQALGLDPSERVVRVHRLRTGDGKPLGIQTSWVRYDIAPGLENEDLGERSLYALLRERYHVSPMEAVEEFRVGAVDEESADLLDVAVGSCAFEVERTTYNVDGPYEYVTSLMRGDRYVVRVVLRG